MTWRKRSVSTAGEDKALEGYSGGPPRSQGEERDDDRGERHHAELAAQDREHDRPLPRLLEAPARLPVLEPAGAEHGLRRGGAELLGDEADRDRQQRVEPEQPVGRIEARRRRDPGQRGKDDRGRLAGAREDPERARGRDGPPAPASERRRESVDGSSHEG